VGAPPEESLQYYVLEPVTTAESVLDQEYKEVAAERRAFEQFQGRVAAVETVSDVSAAPATRVPLYANRSRVRCAFRETVMSGDHYDEVYGESLVKHAAAELSDEIAAGLRGDAHLQFTPCSSGQC